MAKPTPEGSLGEDTKTRRNLRATEDAEAQEAVQR
jgi:hypothetical protein